MQIQWKEKCICNEKKKECVEFTFKNKKNMK